MKHSTDRDDHDSSPRLDDSADEQRRALRDLRVGFDGRRYRFGGYRYDRYEDAVAYARLIGSRPQVPRRDGDAPEYLAFEAPAVPSADERRLMASTGVGFERGRYVFGRFRYDRIEDAVAYAMRAGRSEEAGPRPDR